jgi:hypothetical protein
LQAWNLGSNIEVFDAELFVIKQATQLASERVIFQTEDIWIYSDSKAAIKRLAQSSRELVKSVSKTFRSWLKIFTQISMFMFTRSLGT